MKNFIIWPILVPALAFCKDDQISSQEPMQGIELDALEAIDIAAVTESTSQAQHEVRDNPDYDDFLQKPPPKKSIQVPGTIEEQNGEDLYNDSLAMKHYDDQDVDDEANIEDETNVKEE